MINATIIDGNVHAYKYCMRPWYSSYMQSVFKFFLINAVILAIPLFSHAQIVGTGFPLVLAPQYPEAYQEYTVQISSPDTNWQLIQWFINGIEDIASKNKSSITLQAGAVGSTTDITMKITRQGGSTIKRQHTVTPYRVDLIVDADTVTPPFYFGRTLPSSGSTIKTTALIFSKENHSLSGYSYVWKLNGKIQAGGIPNQDNTYSFIPSFEDEALLSVDVFNNSGQVIASKSQLIPIAKPELNFYEKNPLRGLSFTALADPYLFIEDEVTIRAEGYFMSRELLSKNVLMQWKINGKSVQNSENEEQEITLQKEGNTGRSKLSFHIRNLQQLLQGVQDDITIQF